ncbi:MAG: hypothetical protein ABIS18_04990, partial [Actinomycetota bacterium]
MQTEPLQAEEICRLSSFQSLIASDCAEISILSYQCFHLLIGIAIRVTKNRNRLYSSQEHRLPRGSKFLFHFRGWDLRQDSMGAGMRTEAYPIIGHLPHFIP